LDVLKGKPLDAKVALCLFVSARANHKPKQLCEILRYTTATTSKVNSCLKKTMTTVFSHVDFRSQPSDIIDKVIYKASLPEDVRSSGKEAAEKLKPFMEGKPPRTIAGVALYFVSKQYRRSDRDALSRIAEAVGVA
jgi:transcription initiation factor TFIIIB Brf1 subunit/transcription initiation factor TFIIB